MPNIRYYLIKEVDGVIVRKTEIVHAEPRDSKGRYRSPDRPPTSEKSFKSLAKSASNARKCRCPKCGYEFLVA